MLQIEGCGCSIFTVVYPSGGAGFFATWGNARGRAFSLPKFKYNRNFAAMIGAELQQICGCMLVAGVASRYSAVVAGWVELERAEFLDEVFY